MRVDSLRADEQAPHLPMPVKAQDHLEPAAICCECGSRSVPARNMKCDQCRDSRPMNEAEQFKLWQTIHDHSTWIGEQ